MPIRMSTLFTRTLREDPSDAEVPGHRLLVRGGYIRRAAPGAYSLMPLGWMVVQHVEQIIREEMDRSGFQEVRIPTLLPREPYEATGRWTEYGENLFRLQDRRENDFLLAPTHEEMFTLLAKDIIASYKDLPVSLYQIQTKFRDEARPRAGLLRGREFSMKDSYSFDLDDDGLAHSYDLHREAYIRTFERLSLPTVIVSAMSGAMGGSRSEEFLVPTEIGEDTFVRCPSCGYAANTEAAETLAPEAASPEGLAPAEVVDTPNTPTIESLVDLLNAQGVGSRSWSAGDTLKNVVVMLRHPDGSTEPLAIGVPGDREVDLKRIEAQLSPATVEPFGEADFAKHPALVKGYIGPGALGTSSASGIRYVTDPRVVPGSAWVTGADVAGRHVVGLVAGRDFSADGTLEAVEVQAGDQCPRCGSGLEIARAVEIGHIFQLGRKYAEALDFKVLGPEGVEVVVTMGSYGIGVTRAVGCIAELHHDDAGLIWPPAIAPAQVHVVVAGRDDVHAQAATDLAAALVGAGLRVIVDDRTDVSAGVKFGDADLMGMPVIVIAGRGVANGTLELKDRRTGERTDVAIDAAVAAIQQLLAAS